MTRFGFVILPFLLFALLLSTSKADEQRINYGVIFQNQPNIDFATDYWTHIYEIPMYLNLQHKLVTKCPQRAGRVCQSYDKIVAQVNYMKEYMNAQIQDTKSLIDKLIPKLNRTVIGKSKRALIPFVGSIMGGLFGLITEDSMKKIVTHINSLTSENNKISNALKQYGGSLASFVSQTEKRLDNAMQGIENNYQGLIFLNALIQRDFKNLEDHYTDYFQILTDQSQDSITLQNYIIDLKTAIINLIEGKLSPILLKPDVIQQTVSDIQTILNANYTGFKILTSNPHYYYNYAKYIVLQNNTKLYLVVQFPLTTHGKLFEVYKIKSFPVAVTTNNSHATQLFDLPKYMLITHDRKFFTTLTFEQMNMCQGITPKHCNFNPVFESSNTTECAFHIFSNDKQKIKTFCDFKFLPNAISPQIVQISDDSVLIYKYDNLNLMCNDKNITVAGCSFCIFKIPCHCILFSKLSHFATKLSLCVNGTNDFTKLHPVNLAILQHFFDDTKIANILANTTFPNPVSISLPNFTIYKNKMSHIFAKDEKYHLNLKKLVTRVKKQNTIYSTLADSMVDGQIDLNFESWPTTNDILSLIAIIITSLNTVVLIWLFYKFKVIAAAIAIYQPVQSSATTLPNFKFQPATTQAPSTWINVLNSNITWDHAVFTLAFISFLMTIFLVIKSFKRTNMNTKLCLEITTGFNCVCIPIFSMPLCPTYWDVQYPNIIDNLTVVNYFRPKLHISYPNFTVRNKNTSQFISVPEIIDLNIFQACTLRSILKQPFSAYIILLHQNIKCPINNVNMLATNSDTSEQTNKRKTIVYPSTLY